MDKLLGVVTFVIIANIWLATARGSHQQRPQGDGALSPTTVLREEVEYTAWKPLNCTGRPDGTYPDYESRCRTFYSCQAGQTYTFWCENNTLFNPSTGHCDLPSKVQCADQDEPICRGDGLYTDYGSGCKNFHFCRGGRRLDFRCPNRTRFDWKHGTCRPLNLVPCEPTTCEGRSDGTYTDYADGCRRYYSCQDGIAREGSCPPGKLFDDRTGQCASTRDVSCSDTEGKSCGGLPDAYYPDFRSGCHDFSRCLHGMIQRYSCPGDLLFNVLPLACDYPVRAACRVPHDGQCTRQKNGVVVDVERDCREFVVCRDGVALHYGVCPQGQAMDPVTATCESADKVTCVTKRDAVCEGHPDGPRADYQSKCSRFFMCLNGRNVVTSSCPNDTFFDPAVEECLPEGDVVCRPPSVSGALLIPQYDCNSRVGLFSDFSSKCRRYFVCAVGHQEALLCPEGQRFNSNTGRCEAKALVTCQAPNIIGSFRCGPEGDGIFPEKAGGCRVWHECWREMGTTYMCPSGKTFNVHKGVCDDDSQHSCFADDTKVVFTAPKIPVSKVTKSTFNCSQKFNGVYRGNATECNYFHICVRGVSYSYTLPEGFTLPTGVGDIVGRPVKGNCSIVSPLLTDAASCQGVPDGLYVDRSSLCRRYFICDKGNIWYRQCPKGQLFDVVKKSCTVSRRVNCTLMNASTAPSDEKTINSVSLTSPTLLREDTMSAAFKGRSTSLETSTTPPFHCPLGQPGFFPDFDSNCRKFYICFLNVVKTYSCPSQLLFNPLSKNCDLPDKVRCDPLAKPFYDCYGKTAGSYADPISGCRQYYTCSEGRAVLYSCPRGRLFDENTQTCAIASTVQCEDNNAQSLYGKKAGPKFMGSKRDIPHVHGVPGRFLFDCADRPDGFYADYPRNCHVFYRCIRGKKFSHYCKQGLLFNPKINICDFEENVDCSSNRQPNKILR